MDINWFVNPAKLFVSFRPMRSILFLLICFPFVVPAQELKLLSSTPLQADSFVGIDGYRNTYFVKNNMIYKIGPEGSFSYNDFLLGGISSVDIINPLKVVVYYHEVNTVVFLDNKLNEIERISLNAFPDYMNNSSATNAGNNRLWIFNIDRQQLELFDYRTYRKTIVSQPISGRLLSQASNFNYCFLLSEDKLRSYNAYGSLLQETPIEGFQKIVQENENLVAMADDKLYYISANSISPIKFPPTEKAIKDLQLTQDLLYIYDGINILTYSLTQPKQ